MQDFLRRAHGTLTVVWFVMLPVSIATGWIYSLAFISACSIYANAGTHFGAWQASKAEKEASSD